MGNTEGDDEPRAAAGDGLPGWASRHLAEAEASGVTAPAARAPGRHRTARRREPSRLRGWALATAAVAAATGTVPLALSTLAREEAPMPRVGTFPVVAPADLGPGAVRAGADTGPGPGPDLAATLPPMTTDGEPVVAPTAQNRPLPVAPRAAAPREGARAAQPPRRSTPAEATTTTTTTTTTPRPTSSTPADPDDDDRTDDPDPRDGPSTTTTRTTPSDEERDTGRKGERDDAPRQRSVLDSAVGTVGDLGGRLLG